MSDDQDRCECFFWYRPTLVVPDQNPLDGCVCVLVLNKPWIPLTVNTNAKLAYNTDVDSCRQVFLTNITVFAMMLTGYVHNWWVVHDVKEAAKSWYSPLILEDISIVVVPRSWSRQWWSWVLGPLVLVLVVAIVVFTSLFCYVCMWW